MKQRRIENVETGADCSQGSLGACWGKMSLRLGSGSAGLAVLAYAASWVQHAVETGRCTWQRREKTEMIQRSR